MQKLEILKSQNFQGIQNPSLIKNVFKFCLILKKMKKKLLKKMNHQRNTSLRKWKEKRSHFIRCLNLDLIYKRMFHLEMHIVEAENGLKGLGASNIPGGSALVAGRHLSRIMHSHCFTVKRSEPAAEEPGDRREQRR